MFHTESVQSLFILARFSEARLHIKARKLKELSDSDEVNNVWEVKNPRMFLSTAVVLNYTIIIEERGACSFKEIKQRQ